MIYKYFNIGVDKHPELWYTKSMTNNNDNTKGNEMRTVNDMINTLKDLGCTDINVSGVSDTVPMGGCWSMVLPNGTKWAGGVGAVRLLIRNNCKSLRMTRRDVLRLSHDANGKRWTVANGG